MIYAVFGGEYSDWYPVGYFEDKDEAEAYCAEFNKLNRWNQYYFMEMPNLKEQSNDCKRLCYEVDLEDGYVARASYYDDDEPEERLWITDEDDPRQVYIWLYAWQLPKAIKIAADKVAFWKARKAGIA